jgi:uncharacterized protein YjbI with pentapeptide repeats
MLAANVRHFITALKAMVPLATDREHCRQLLANVEFVQSLTAPPGSPLRSRLFGFVAWVVIAAFPVIVLLAVQTNALRYQNATVTTVQRASLLIDLAVLFWFYNRQWRRRSPTGSDVFGVALRRWGVCLGLPIAVVAADVARLNVVGPDATWVERYVPSVSEWTWKEVGEAFYQPLDLFLCPMFDWGCRFLRVDHRTLVGKVWDNKAIIELSAGGPLTDERRASFEGVFLRGRNLRHAKLSESHLYAANLGGADLTSADLTNADLTGANLFAAHLTGANLVGANLTGANLFAAHLSAAHLSAAHLSAANLTGANLVGADLTIADLTGAHLFNANLAGANLTGATLTGAHLTDANLSEARLTFANLSEADLTGTYLVNADLLGVKNLTQTQLSKACGKPNTLPEGLTLDRPCPEKPVVSPLNPR